MRRPAPKEERKTKKEFESAPVAQTDPAAQTQDMALINRYTRRQLTEEEVYTFPVVLCDNEIDRDFERFSCEALERLCTLFVGKTGIFDHNPKGENQTARIYRAEVVRDSDRVTGAGEAYHYLLAQAYMVRGEHNRDLILEIDAGIKKEVSVSCRMERAVCSVCGADQREGQCAHKKGERYPHPDGALCHHILSEPSDAYEWSFVAVPAQAGAGVRSATQKRFCREDLDSLLGSGALTSEAGERLKGYLRQTSEAARLGDEWRRRQEDELVRCGMLALDGVDCKSLRAIAGRLESGELQMLSLSLQKKAAQQLPVYSQLLGELPGKQEIKKGESQFRI